MQRFNIPTVALIVAVALAGCVTKKQADAQARAAFLAGQQRGMALVRSENTVWVVGNVKLPLVPWTPDLTLAKAIVASGYLNPGDPSRISVFRNGQPPVTVSAKQILGGFDMPLQAGDRVEIRP